jgi:hypothetical protein
VLSSVNPPEDLGKGLDEIEKKYRKRVGTIGKR